MVKDSRRTSAHKAAFLPWNILKKAAAADKNVSFYDQALQTAEIAMEYMSYNWNSENQRRRFSSNSRTKN